MTSEAQPGQEQRMDDLIERLRGAEAYIRTANRSSLHADAVQEAADRLILYREALEAVIARAPERDLKWAGMTARDIAIAVLSRSGG